ncbi:src substrate protein p85-like [Ostrinia furnacalis]|uniref:src substrate protein p85-like n=1 Tax=Ostrinia furnacalis TaxID=93504 RepID=UPI00103D991A|nr:src substrate protein p85-like [Ostrinia furnacalis]
MISDEREGFGGKFGVQTDRMDASAVGHDYVGTVDKHESQTDYSRGFGGKYGVQTDRVDKTDYARGFGGKYGVQTDRVDKVRYCGPCVLGRRKVEFGVQTDRMDASAVGHDYV